MAHTPRDRHDSITRRTRTNGWQIPPCAHANGIKAEFRRRGHHTTPGTPLSVRTTPPCPADQRWCHDDMIGLTGRANETIKQICNQESQCGPTCKRAAAGTRIVSHSLTRQERNATTSHPAKSWKQQQVHQHTKSSHYMPILRRPGDAHHRRRRSALSTVHSRPRRSNFLQQTFKKHELRAPRKASLNTSSPASDRVE